MASRSVGPLASEAGSKSSKKCQPRQDQKSRLAVLPTSTKSECHHPARFLYHQDRLGCNKGAIEAADPSFEPFFVFSGAGVRKITKIFVIVKGATNDQCNGVYELVAGGDETNGPYIKQGSDDMFLRRQHDTCDRFTTNFEIAFSPMTSKTRSRLG